MKRKLLALCLALLAFGYSLFGMTSHSYADESTKEQTENTLKQEEISTHDSLDSDTVLRIGVTLGTIIVLGAAVVIKRKYSVEFT